MNKGDHIRVNRGGYYHHGINMDGSTVMHFTGEPTRKSLSSKIKRTSFIDFLEGGRLEVVAYQTSQIIPVEHTVAIAWSQENRDGYHLFNNNCEHFATFCKTGQGYSYQLDKAGQEARDWSRKIAVAVLQSSKNIPAVIAAALLGGVTAVGISKIMKYGIHKLKNIFNQNSTKMVYIGSQYFDSNGYNYFQKNTIKWKNFVEGWHVLDPNQQIWFPIEKSPPFDVILYAYIYKNSNNEIFMENKNGLFILSN